MENTAIWLIILSLSPSPDGQNVQPHPSFFGNTETFRSLEAQNAASHTYTRYYLSKGWVIQSKWVVLG